MPFSMTGYSEAAIRKNNVKIDVTIKSLNHRFLEIASLKIPELLKPIEKEISRILKSYFSRGRFELSFNVDLADKTTEKNVEVDWNAAKAYFGALKQIKDNLKINGDISLSDIASNPALFIYSERKPEYNNIDRLGIEALHKAAKKLKTSRQKEGASLVSDINKRMTLVTAKVEGIKKLAAHMPKGYSERMKKRLKNLNDHRDVPEEKIAELIAIAADRSDISEELSRLKIHIDHFREILKSKVDVGKKLDFYIQEINREVNTIGSKAINALITENVVSIKGELEKIREQVQNIE
ncbi:MAG: YicC family protein [Candidatus Schekmanbacteria bacterium]|nr:YicC family protein [Candidatus Schekmanbacteria bacterium]